MDKKLSKEAVLKAFEQCGQGSCKNCAYAYGEDNVYCKQKQMHVDVLEIIEDLEKRNGILLVQKDAMEANCIAYQKQVDELTSTLKNAVDSIINSSIDCCRLCVYLKECNEWPEDIPDDVEPCQHKRERGNDGCREGIIKYFKEQAQKTSRSEGREKTVQVELNALELFYVCDVLEHAIK